MIKETKQSWLKLIRTIHNNLKIIRKYARFYFSKRRFTLYAFYISIIMLLLLIFSLASYYNFDSAPQNSITLDLLSKGYGISGLQVTITYDSEHKDKINLYMHFSPEQDSLTTKTFLLCYSKAWELVTSYNSSMKTHLSRDDLDDNVVYRWYKFTDPYSGTLHEEFRGDIFGGSSQEVTFEIFISVFERSESVHIPATLVIKGLSNVNIGAVIPEPTKRFVDGLYYESIFDNNNVRGNSIFLSGVDRKKIHSTQFSVFLIGTFVGIFISVILTVFFDCLKFVEAERAKPKQRQSLVL